MGVDAFGTPRHRCTDKSGCLCADFCSALDGLGDEGKAAMEAQANVLTCQRKSELVLWCVCGHPAWVHAERPDVVPRIDAPSRAEQQQDEEDNEWSALLRTEGGDVELLSLCAMLSSEISVDEAYTLLGVSRVGLLSRLKQAGLERLRDRQGVANVLGRTRRLAALAEARRANAVAESESDRAVGLGGGPPPSGR